MILPPKKPAPKVTQPWYPNESGTLEQAITELQRTLQAIDSLCTGIESSINNAWWSGADAVQFRHRWNDERRSIDRTRRQVYLAIVALQQDAAAESTRFRAQQYSVGGA